MEAAAAMVMNRLKTVLISDFGYRFGYRMIAFYPPEAEAECGIRYGSECKHGLDSFGIGAVAYSLLGIFQGILTAITFLVQKSAGQ